MREHVARKLAAFTGRPISAAEELIITPGTQGALFLALGAAVNAGDRVGIVRPDYFANRKLVVFLGCRGRTGAARLPGTHRQGRSGPGTLGGRFQVRRPHLSLLQSQQPDRGDLLATEITAIAELANQYGVTVIADELYSRLLYSDQTYTHICAAGIAPTRWSPSWDRPRRNP